MIDKKHERKKILEAVTKRDILEAVVTILTHDGIQGFTMDKVAMEAGVAKGTLYTYFKNKERILEAAIDINIEPLTKELGDLLDSDLAPNRKLEKFSEYLFKFFDTHKDLFRILLYDRQQSHLKRNRYRTTWYWTFVEKTARVLDDGVQSGLFRHLDSSKVAAMFIEASIAVVIHRLWCEDSERIEGDVGLISEVFLHGIAASSSSQLKDKTKQT
jgi:TetR/AcrR family transcriptional regulator